MSQKNPLTSKLLLRGLVLVLSAAVASTAIAEDAKSKREARKNRQNTNKRAALLDSKTQGHSIRASKLIGMNIENRQEKNVGEIQDIVLNAKTGKIQYVAVTYGGFLGLGNKMFAVPFEAFKVTRDPDDPNDPDDLVLVLDVTEKQMEGAEGFDEDHWPNFADKNFTRGLYKRYGVDRKRNRRFRDRDVDVKIDRNGVDVDVDKDSDK